MNYCPYCMNAVNNDDVKCSSCGKDTSAYRADPHMLPAGAMLNNRYLVGSAIGEGGFGITYIGMDTLLEFKVAIKEFYPNGMVNRNNTISNEVHSISTENARILFSKSRDNFLHEARTLAKFTNESGIVSVKDFFEENHTVYIVMEYLEGITLKDYLKQVGTMSSYNTVCLLLPVFRSLKKIHEKNLIHRDISPDNIMLVGEQIKLLDFGAAREFADEKSLSVMLKHGYAPMEQYRRHGTQGTWTDVYAICATMYKCITGEVPPDATDRVFEDDLKMPSELGFDVTAHFEDVLRRGLAIRPEERIQTIDELLESIAEDPEFDMDVDSVLNGSQSNDNTAFGAQGVTAAVVNSRTTASGNEESARLSEYVPRSSLEDDEDPDDVENIEDDAAVPEPAEELEPEPESEPEEETEEQDIIPIPVPVSEADAKENDGYESIGDELTDEPFIPEDYPAEQSDDDDEKKSSKFIIPLVIIVGIVVVLLVVLLLWKGLFGTASNDSSEPETTAQTTTTVPTTTTTATTQTTTAPETTSETESTTKKKKKKTTTEEKTEYYTETQTYYTYTTTTTTADPNLIPEDTDPTDDNEGGEESYSEDEPVTGTDPYVDPTPEDGSWDEWDY